MSAARITILVAALIGFEEGARAAPAPELYFVDLQEVVLASPEGKAAKTELARTFRRLEAKIAAKESEIYRLQDAAASAKDPAALERLDRAFDDLERARAEAQKELQSAEAARLDPLLITLRRSIESWNRRIRGVHVVELSAQPIIHPNPICDRSSALLRSGAATFPSAIARDARCRTERIVYVDYDRVARESKAGQQAAVRLKQFQETEQAELDRSRAKVSELKREASSTGSLEKRQEYLARRAQLARTYRSIQRALKEKEDAEQDRLFAAFDARIAEAARVLAGTVFIEAGGAKPLSPSCDGTGWAIRFVEKRARVDGLERDCLSNAPEPVVH